MKALFYKGKFYKEIEDNRAEKLSQTLTSTDKRPIKITFDGETLSLSQIEIRNCESINVINNSAMDREKHLNKIRIEREEMSKWTPEKKIEWNLKRFFKVSFLLSVGYSNFLNSNGVKDWKNELSPDDINEQFTFVYKKDKGNDMVKLFEDMKRFFVSNPDEIFCDNSIYNKYLPKFNNTAMNNLGIDKFEIKK